MSVEPIYEAKMIACYLAADCAGLASDLSRCGLADKFYFVSSAHRKIKAMRAALNQIEGILESEVESNV